MSPKGWPSCAGLLSSLALALVVASGCGKSDAPFGSGTSTGIGGAGAASGGGHSSGGGTGTGTGVGGAYSCAAEAYPAEAGRLDLFFLVDKSASMRDENRWDHMVGALVTFTSAPTSDGIGVALQLFPQPPSQAIPTTCASVTDPICGIYGPCMNIGGFQCTGSLSPLTSCDALDYATPPLAFTLLPGAATPFSGELTDATPPDGDATPTLFAMEAAVSYSTSWAQSHPDHVVDIVLATDGAPTGCTGPDMNNPVNTAAAVATLAQGAAEADPPIRTFVIGVGYEHASLHLIAAAGGTNQAYLVDTSATATQQLVQALDEIAVRGECRFEIPTTSQGSPDYAATVVSTVLVSDPTQSNGVGRVASQDLCDPTTGGWSYDDPIDPELILLCPASCQEVVAGTRNVRIVVPCSE